MKHSRAFLSALITSILLHGVLVATTSNMQLPGFSLDVLTPPRKVFQVKNLKTHIPPVRRPEQQGDGRFETMQFEQPQLSSQVLNAIGRIEPMLNKEQWRSKQRESIQLAQTNRDEFDYELLSQKDPRTIKRGQRRETRSGLVMVGDVESANEFNQPDAEALDAETIPKDFATKMPGFTPTVTIESGFVGAPSRTTLEAVESNPMPAIKRAVSFEDLDEYLITELSTYRDPQDGEKYFRISLRAGDDGLALPSYPKELVFLIDCSISIKRQRLDEFKEGVKYALNNLNPDDIFNVVAFKEEAFRFQTDSVKPTADNIEKALKFIDGLTSGQKTDTFNALYRVIQTPITQSPSYLIFLSDGRPTKGVTDPTRVINEISRYNNGERSIFSFTGGLRVNRYLLDFISYKNRGWSEYSERTHQIDEYLMAMYDKIQNPLLLNLRYRARGIDPEKMFPKLLPDLFKAAEFTLYGKYDDEEEFSMQLLGDVDQETRELIISGDLKNAPQGSKDIARNWAFNKIYHLIGQLEYNRNNKSLIKQIRTLSKKFNIRTPYLKVIQ